MYIIADVIVAGARLFSNEGSAYGQTILGDRGVEKEYSGP